MPLDNEAISNVRAYVIIYRRDMPKWYLMSRDTEKYEGVKLTS